MNLYEFEGKQILKESGFRIPRSILINSSEEDNKIDLDFPVILKSQVLSGKRQKAGGIIKVNTQNDVQKNLKTLFSLEINKEKPKCILAEEMVTHEKEFYCSITYDTDIRGAVLTISSSGGTGIEERESIKYPISTINPQAPETEIPKKIIQKLLQIFFDNDCLLLEINPLVQSGDDWFALDAKIKLDDDAQKRHPEWNFNPRSAPGHCPSESEIAAKKIDALDYRGTAGSTYFDLDGDIAILASGGGVSLVAVDELFKAGGKPSNYTEYSGNPPKEKVIQLTKIVLSKPNIKGLWVIGTVAANFTDIYETLKGILEGLRYVKKETGKKIDYPIVIRRGGPRDQEIFDELKNIKEFDFYLHGKDISITESAKIISELTKKYASST